jgi:mono/diheme cytochrome c family protein
VRRFAICLAVALGACTQEEGPGPSSARPPPPTVAPAAPAPAGLAASQPAAGTSTLATRAAEAPTADGQKLYMRICIQCHGPDGTGQMMRAMYPKIGDLTSSELHGRMSDDQIAQLIKTGRDKMPPLGGALSDEQIKAIISYVRTLQRS